MKKNQSIPQVPIDGWVSAHPQHHHDLLQLENRTDALFLGGKWPGVTLLVGCSANEWQWAFLGLTVTPGGIPEVVVHGTAYPARPSADSAVSKLSKKVRLTENSNTEKGKATDEIAE